MKRILAAVVLGGCALFAGSAHATQLNATFAATITGIIEIPGGENLNNANSIDFDSEAYLVTSVPANYLSNPNAFSGGEYSIGGIGAIADSINISAFTEITNFMTWTGASGAQYFFNLETLVRNASSSGAMDLFGTGTFGANGGAAPFDNVTSNTAAWRLTAQEQGGNISASFSWGTPAFDNPTTEVPEPATLALLGAGLLGLVFLVRRSRRVADNNGENRGAAA